MKKILKILNLWHGKFQVVISMLVGILSIVVIYMLSSPMQIAMNNPVTDEDYTYLKTYTLYSIQSPSELLTNDNIKISKEVKQGYYHVKAILTENNTDKCGITAIFPILEYNETIDEDKVHIDMKIDYSNVEYAENVIVLSISFYIILACIIGFFVGGGIYKGLDKMEFYISRYLYKKNKKES